MMDPEGGADKGPLPVQQTGGARSTHARVLAMRGQFPEPERVGRQAVQTFAGAQSPNSQGAVSMDLAEVLLKAGQKGEAERAARDALNHFERKGNRRALASARTFLEGLGV